MSLDALFQPADRRFRLLLVDEDAVFRLGLRVWLERYPELQIAAEAADGEEALRFLAEATAIDLVILDVGSGRMQGLTLCQQIKALYPQLLVLFLGANTEPVLVAAAQQVGAAGYCAKSLAAAELATVIRQVLQRRSRFVERGSAPELGLLIENTAIGNSSPRRSSLFAQLRTALSRSGMRQIEAALTEVNADLRSLDLSLLDRAILAGQQRELRAARWLVDRLRSKDSIEQPHSQESAKTDPKFGSAVGSVCCRSACRPACG